MRLPGWCLSLFAMTLSLGGLDARAAEATPPFETVLSYLRAGDSTACEWVLQPLPSGAPTTLVGFNQYCSHAQIDWSADRRQALIWMPEQDPSQSGHAYVIVPGKLRVYRLWWVDLVEKKSTPLEVQELLIATARVARRTDWINVHSTGFDDQGRPVVILSLQVSPDTIMEGKKTFRFEGKRYPMSKGEGWSGLAIAYRWTGAKWERIELKTTNYPTPGIQVLKTTAGLRRSEPSFPVAFPGEKATAALATTVDKTLPPTEKDSGHWRALPSSGATFVYRAQPCKGARDPMWVAQDPVRWEQNGVLSTVEQPPLLAERDCDGFKFLLQGRWLALSARIRDDLDKASEVRVYDTQTKKLLVSLPNARFVHFLP